LIYSRGFGRVAIAGNTEFNATAGPRFHGGFVVSRHGVPRYTASELFRKASTSEYNQPTVPALSFRRFGKMPSVSSRQTVEADSPVICFSWFLRTKMGLTSAGVFIEKPPVSWLSLSVDSQYTGGSLLGQGHLILVIRCPRFIL
jgi:hypothetical protein